MAYFCSDANAIDLCLKSLRLYITMAYCLVVNRGLDDMSPDCRLAALQTLSFEGNQIDADVIETLIDIALTDATVKVSYLLFIYD